MVDIREFLYEILKEESKVVYRYKPAVKDDLSSDSIDKKRDVKRWKNSLNYYYQNPENFKFGLKNL